MSVVPLVVIVRVKSLDVKQTRLEVALVDDIGPSRVCIQDRLLLVYVLVFVVVSD